MKEICWLRVKTESLLFLSPTPNMTLCSQCLPEQEGGGLCFPAHALSSSVPEVPIQSGAFPIPALAVGPSANHLAQTQYAQGSQRQCGRGGFNSHPSRPHPDATTLIRPPLIFPADARSPRSLGGDVGLIPVANNCTSPIPFPKESTPAPLPNTAPLSCTMLRLRSHP